jgi:hypothetical protein
MNLFKVSNLGLITTAFSAIASFMFFGATNFFLNDEEAASFRYLMNWGLTLSLILCFGWDSAIARVSTAKAVLLKDFSQQVLPVVSLLFCVIGLIMSSDSLLIFSFSITLVSVLIYYNFIRAKGEFTQYIFGLNVYDKALRVLVFVIVALVFHENLFPVFIIIYQLSVFRIRKNIISLVREGGSYFVSSIRRKQNIMYLMAGAYMAFSTKGVYLLDSGGAPDALIALDFVLLCSMFLLVPIQTIMKFKEVVSTEGDSIKFNDGFSHNIKISLVEMFIVVLICIVIFVSETLVGFNGLHSDMVLGVLCLHVAISTFPNPMQILAAESSLIKGLITVSILILAMLTILNIDSYLDKFLIISVVVLLVHIAMAYMAKNVFSKQFLLLRWLRTGFLIGFVYCVWGVQWNLQ